VGASIKVSSVFKEECIVRYVSIKKYAITIIWLICFSSSILHAQVDSSKEIRNDQFSIGLGIHKGFIFAHSQAVQNTKGSHPTGIEGILSWQRVDSAVWSLCNCFPRKGLILAYYDYDNNILGKSVTAAYFLEPVYRLSNKAAFSLRGSAGISYLTNPFDSIRNPFNQSYSTALSAYLLLGVGSWFRLNDQWQLNISFNYQHISNGGMREPNKGINWPTAGIALTYQQRYFPYFKGQRNKEKFWINKPITWNITSFGTARRMVNENGNSQRLLLLGMSLQAAKQVGRINNITLGTEVSLDNELKKRLQKDSIQSSNVLGGLLAGHEFILGKFLLSQQLGLYYLNQTPYYDRLYHRWGLSYKINKRMGIGLTLKAHRQVADYADLRFSYSFQSKTIN